MAYTPPAGRTFYWTMESQTADEFPPGTDNLAQYDQGATLTSAQAYAGTQSLAVGGGTYRSATFDNPTSQHKWNTPTKGRMVWRFRYTGTIGTSQMLGQITGKDRTDIDSTNDSVKVEITGTNAVATYSYAGGASSVTVTTTLAIAADTWHEADVEWNTAATGGNPTLSLRINSTTNTTTSAIGAVNCTTWHHLLIGQDKPVTPTGLWIDEFEAYAIP